MKSFQTVALLVGAFACAAATGCTTASSPAVPTPARMAPAVAQRESSTTGSGRIYVANGRSNSIDIYEKNPPHHLLGTITKGLSGPNAMAVDPSGDLFVSNVDDQTVTMYQRGSLSPSVTYRRGFHGLLVNPLTVALGPDGTLYLVNYTHVGMNSQVLEYPPGQKVPDLAIPINGGADGLAVDPNNNLFVSVNTPTTGLVLEFAPGSKTGHDLGIRVGFAGGLALDKALDLLVCDQTAPSVDVFPPGATTPSLVIKGSFVNPYGLAFGEFFTRLYVADSASNVVSIFSYPDGAPLGQIKRQFTAFGIAIDPAAQP